MAFPQLAVSGRKEPARGHQRTMCTPNVKFPLLLILFTVTMATFCSSMDSLEPENLDPFDDHSARLAILLVCTPMAGHSYPLVALGEELVRRGHNVTLCSLEN